jgi:hypothetical protein
MHTHTKHMLVCTLTHTRTHNGSLSIVLFNMCYVLFSYACILIGQGCICRYIFMVMYNFILPFCEAKFCGVLSCVFDKLGYAADEERLWNTALYSLPGKMRGDVNKVEQGEVLLLLPNPVPHPVSFHITVLVFSKNELAVILFFTAIINCSIILESIHHVNNVKCYSYRCC